ncbi:MAG: DegT/DnrJ/EryC1/StrS family aminotransferase [Oligoflexia bacterium]|nr:DegT/DnrJ/EryC1/StrS family aminotransferase [Oligoflexia bacterium]
MVLYGQNSQKANELLGGNKNNFTTKKFTYFTKDGEYAIFRIDKITKENVENVKVYNFRVKCDHSYHVNGLTVHNCRCQSVQNLLPHGVCGERFNNWLSPNYEGIVDHRYSFDIMGANLLPLDLQGAIGNVQLDKIDEIFSKRKHSYDVISNLFVKYIDGVKLPEKLDKADPMWFGTPLIVKDKEMKNKLVTFLEKYRIQTRNFFAGNLLLHKGYEKLDDYKKYPMANEVLEKVLFVGASPSYNDVIFQYIEDTLKEYKNV